MKNTLRLETNDENKSKVDDTYRTSSYQTTSTVMCIGCQALRAPMLK